VGSTQRWLTSAFIALSFGIPTAVSANAGPQSPGSLVHCAAHTKVSRPIATVRLLATHHRTHLKLKQGQALRVVTHDHSYRGTMAAMEKPGSHVLCVAKRSGTRNRKVVIFEALHPGTTYVDATYLAAPGLAERTERLRIRVT
jgi:hypothetical protein